MDKRYIFVLMLLGLGLLMFLLALLAKKIDNRKSILGEYIKINTKKISWFDNLLNSLSFITNYELTLEKKYKRIFTEKYTSRVFVKIMIGGGALGLILDIFIKNIFALPLLIFIGCYLPLLYLNILKKKSDNKIEVQFEKAINLIITNYSITKSMLQAIQKSIPKLKDPIKKEFERLNRELNSGINNEIAIKNFGERLNNEYAYIFSQLLIAHFKKGLNIMDSLFKIASDIRSNQIKYRERKTELTMIRGTLTILNITFFVSLLIMFIFLPNWALIFKTTIQGQILLFLAIVLSFISIVIEFGISVKNK